MSFILDALKKSETERRRQTVPGVADVAAAAPRVSLPLWSVGLGVLLAVNLLVLGVYWWRQDKPAPVPNAASAQAAHPAPAGAVKPFSPLDPGPIDAPEIPVNEAPAQRVEPQPSPAAPTATRLPDAVNDDEPVPTIYDLTAAGQQSVPQMHLDIHVYATKPSDRFVFINNRKYREGARTEDGATIARITRDGVVLDYHGLRFLLPRQ